MEQKIHEMFKQIDAKSVDGFTQYLTEDCAFTLGNMPALSGKSAIVESLSGFFSSIKAISHSDLELFQEKNSAFWIVKGIVSYTKLDDTILQVPFCNILEYDGDLIEKYTVYVDNHEIFS